MLKYSLLLVVLVSTASHADDGEFRVNATEILGYGIFEVSSSAPRAGFSKETVSVDSVRGVRFTNHTDRIPAILDTKFGFRYAINSTPVGQKLPIRSVIHFPEPGLHRPDGLVYRESVENKHVRLGKSSLHGFGFDEPWEMVPGEWVFEIWHGDALLIRKTFTVEEVPQLSAVDDD